MTELKSLKIWVLWRLTENKDGKTTKIPYAASGGATGTDEKYRHTWVTYEEAVAAAKERGASGVGFVIPEGWFCLDIDHVKPDDSFVKNYVSRFCSYTEISQSKNGVHIYGKVDLSKLPVCVDQSGKRKLDRAFYTKNSKKNLELYIGGLTNRFMVYTGDALNDMPVCDCTAVVNSVLDKDMRRAEKQRYNPERDGNTPEDREVFDIIKKLGTQKNGERFQKLFVDGDCSDYGSPSEVDAALCSMIAFRAGNDPGLIDKVFRQSALVRQKWLDREEYRNSTIQVGIQSCNGQFIKSKMPHPAFIYTELDGKEKINPALLAKDIRENAKYRLVRDNGKQALQIYVYEDGVYRLYSPDMFKGLIIDRIKEYDESLVSIAKVNDAFNQLMTERSTLSQEDLNSDESIINFKNGILDLKTMKLLPHSPAYMTTTQLPLNWRGKETPTPVYDRYIYSLTGGDRGIRTLLEEFAGVAVSNVHGYRLKKCMFLCGPGNTGKSQFKALIEKILGQGNFTSMDLAEIEARFGTGQLYGTRLAGSSDMSFMTVAEVKTLKKATGGDYLFAEFKGQQGFEYVYNGLMMFCMNRLPRFGGDDGKWVYDRIIVINCDNVVPPEKQDKLLLDKMYAEREGIVYKFVMALNAVVERGYRFDEPDSVIRARKRYRNENSSVISFFLDCMQKREEGTVQDKCSVSRIYNVYKAWCAVNTNGYAKSLKDFRAALAEYLEVKAENMTYHRNDGNYFKDYTLTLQAKKEYHREYGDDCLENSV